MDNGELVYRETMATSCTLQFKILEINPSDIYTHMYIRTNAT